jgi:hypothetical protein
MAYVTKPALIPSDFGFTEPVEKKKVSEKQKPKKVQPKKPKKSRKRTLPWKS